MKKVLIVLMFLSVMSFVGCDYTQQVSSDSWVSISQKDLAWVVRWLDNKLNNNND